MVIWDMLTHLETQIFIGTKFCQLVWLKLDVSSQGDIQSIRFACFLTPLPLLIVAGFDIIAPSLYVLFHTYPLIIQLLNL